MKKFYMYLSTIIGIVGFIGGIVLGNIFGIQENIYTLTKAEFNYAIMFATWLSTFLLVSIFAGIYAILDYEESNYSNIYDLYNRIYRIEKSLKDADEKSAK